MFFGFLPLRNRNFYLMLAGDLVAAAAAWLLAFGLRFDFRVTPEYLGPMWSLLLPVMGTQVLVLCAFGQYRGMWRFTSLGDVARLGQAAGVSTLAIIGWLTVAQRVQQVPRSVWFVDTMVFFLLVTGLRVAIRMCHGHWRRCDRRGWKAWLGAPTGSPPRRALVLDAGFAGERILREAEEHPGLRIDVQGLLDADARRHRRTLRGVPVLGLPGEAGRWIRELNIDLVLTPQDALPGPALGQLVAECRRQNVEIKIVPVMGDIIDGSVNVKELRDVDLEDLLGREPVRLDTSAIEGYLAGETVLVTGAGGSIGSELCRQIARYHPGRMVLVDACEEKLFAIGNCLREEMGNPPAVSVLASVQDEAVMDRLMARYRPHVVFHAAAYKHVPMLEQNPWEAVENNVHGSWVVMRTAVRHQVRRFVLVSTDKAVRPTNIMGATKRVAERLMQCLTGGHTIFMAVRFGNVLGSSGSVVPLFREQIRRGGPVTVTHPDMTRFFMTIPEAAQLIMQAGALGTGGEVFILDMGRPVKIADMAAELIRLSGKRPGVDVAIVHTGVRPGEKLHEELITAGEGIVPTRHEKILVLKVEGRHADLERATLERGLRGLMDVAARHDAVAIREQLLRLVPEYAPSSAAPVI